MKLSKKTTIDALSGRLPKPIEANAVREGDNICLQIGKRLSAAELRYLIQYIVERLIATRTKTTDKKTTVLFCPIPRKAPYEVLCETAQAALKILFSPDTPAPRKRHPVILTPKEIEARKKRKVRSTVSKELFAILDKPVSVLPLINKPTWEKLDLHGCCLGELVILTVKDLEKRGTTAFTIRNIRVGLERYDLRLGMKIAIRNLGWNKPPKPRHKSK